MPTIKLIASDIDGTLLQGGATRLNTAIFPMIRALRERGVLFFAASGRQATNLARLFAPVREDIGYLCENGCLSLWQGEMIHQDIMPRALGQEIARAFWETPGAEVLITGQEVSYVCPKSAGYLAHMKDVVGNDCVIVPDILNTPEPYMKISIFERDGVRNAAHWQARFGDLCTVVTSGNEWLDTMPLGVNKGSGMRHILERLGIAPEECLAIGDNDNDRELL